MMKFPSIIKSAYDSWQHGPDVSVDAAHVIAVEPRQHRYHSFRPEQNYSVLHLSTGGTIEVFTDSKRIEAMLEESR